MNDENVKCKISFKGIENFLRRIAFNLGNTPSQTEVKIISCIPIDVTDLQQKIVTLEKQLDQALGSNKHQTAAFCRTVSTSLPYQCCNTTSSRAEVGPCQHSSISRKDLRGKDCVIDCNECIAPTPSQCPPIQMTNEPLCCTSFCNPINKDMYCCNVYANKKNIFKKTKKRKLPQKNSKTQLVYYAHTIHTPFKSYVVNAEPRNLETRKNHNEKQKKLINNNHSFFEHLMRRQYRPRPLVDQFSGISNFTTPICRDTVSTEQSPPTSAPREYDVCSCIHGTFHNIDNLNDTNPAYMCHNDSNLSIFYDSSFYDMVPVKEKSTKVKKETDIKRVRYRQNFMNPTENTVEAKVRPVIINYHTVAAKKHDILKKSQLRRPRREIRQTISFETTSENDTSRSSYVDCGEVYTKHEQKKSDSPKTVEASKAPLSYKSIGCLTISLLDTECQTTTTGSVQLHDSKTEQTLNQIKSILQSVLTEVKTSSRIKTTSEEKVKKDAVVQKGFSHGNMHECSQNMLNSFQYNPFNINPYANSCLHHTYCSNVPYPKCVHNFPVFIQSPDRNACSNYYKTNPGLCSSNHFHPAKHAMTAGTNTDDHKNQNSETNKLIKEIYKSIALNFDMPTKDTSATEYDELSSVKHNLHQRINSKSGADKFCKSSNETVKSIPRAVFMRDIAMNSSITPHSTKTYNSNLASNTVSVLSREWAADTARHFQSTKNKDKEKYIPKHLHDRSITQQPFESLIEEKSKYKKASSIDITGDVEPSSDEESKEIDLDEPTKKKEKKNIFSKVFKSMKLLKHKNKKRTVTEIVHEESEAETGTYDSDDYETVYSEKINKNYWAKHAAVRDTRGRRKTHSKIRDMSAKRDRHTDRYAKTSYSKQIRARYPDPRKPYLEQEYRRRWNENLMFQDKQPRDSSLEFYPRDALNHMTDSKRYQQNYDTRSAVITANYGQARQTKAALGDAGRFRITEGVVPKLEVLPKNNVPSKGLSWFKKRKLGVECGDQWKKIIFES